MNYDLFVLKEKIGACLEIETIEKNLRCVMISDVWSGIFFLGKKGFDFSLSM